MTTTEAWEHDALAADLAGHLRCESVMTWEDLQLGPVGSVRPDVYSIRKSFVQPSPRAYEVKVTRPDFLSDVTTGKWKSYLVYAESVTFAVPQGLVSKDEVPPTCGLMARGEAGWRTLRRPTPGVVRIPQDAWMKLLIDGVQREGPRCRVRRYADIHAGLDTFAKKFGADAALWVANRAAAEGAIHEAERRAEIIVRNAERKAAEIRKCGEENAPQKWAELCRVLGVPVESSQYDVAEAVRNLRVMANKGGAPWWLTGLRNSLERALAQADEAIVASAGSTSPSS